MHARQTEPLGEHGTGARLGERFVSLEDRRGSDVNRVADLGTSRSGRDPKKQASEEGSLSLRRGIPIFLLGARALPAGSSEREPLANR